eukprot:4609612-Pyramimonas_sp.AAC.1
MREQRRRERRWDEQLPVTTPRLERARPRPGASFPAPSRSRLAHHGRSVLGAVSPVGELRRR